MGSVLVKPPINRAPFRVGERYWKIITIWAASPVLSRHIFPLPRVSLVTGALLAPVTTPGLEKKDHRCHWIMRWNFCPRHFLDEFDVVAALFCHCVKCLLYHLRCVDGPAAHMAASRTAFANELPLLDSLPVRKVGGKEIPDRRISQETPFSPRISRCQRTNARREYRQKDRYGALGQWPRLTCGTAWIGTRLETVGRLKPNPVVILRKCASGFVDDMRHCYFSGKVAFCHPKAQRHA